MAALVVSSIMAALPALWAYSLLAARIPKIRFMPVDLPPLLGASIVFGALFMGLAFAFRMDEARFVVRKLLRLK